LRVRKIWILTLLLTAVLEAGICWKIQNNDLRRYCESVVEGKKNCWLMKGADNKYYCEAIAYHKKTCWQIKKNDRRELCKALTGQ